LPRRVEFAEDSHVGRRHVGVAHHTAIVRREPLSDPGTGLEKTLNEIEATRILLREMPHMGVIFCNNIFSKLHVCDRSQAMLYAIRQRLVKV
jgi:hypothetical protein